MRGFYIFLIGFVGIAWLAVLFFGSVFGFTKAFKHYPQVNKLESRRLEEESKKRIDSTREQQRLFMEEYKRKIRDNQRRF